MHGIHFAQKEFDYSSSLRQVHLDRVPSGELCWFPHPLNKQSHALIRSIINKQSINQLSDTLHTEDELQHLKNSVEVTFSDFQEMTGILGGFYCGCPAKMYNI